MIKQAVVAAGMSCMNEYAYNLGTHSCSITTTSAETQLWFDRALNWIYGYHHEEAGECLQKALEHDPTCVMVYWAQAYNIGPNYNRPWELFDQHELKSMFSNARAALANAEKYLSNASAVEQAMLNALTQRYQSESIPEDLYKWSADYANAMRKVYNAFPRDRDVTTIFVESMMNRTPWKMWDPRSGEPCEGADTLECRQVLERAIGEIKTEGGDPHPGLLHLYIHLMEMSPVPEVALNMADELSGLVPDAGHLEHMATHIYVLCGNYQHVVAGNSAGIKADLKYWENAGAMNFYSLYRVHNYQFKLYGAMFLGQFEKAMEAVRELHETIPDELVRLESPPMADWLEAYMSMDIHVLIRFGKWQALIDLPLPEDTMFYTMSTALNYYGKGIAYAALGHHKNALKAQEKFEQAVLAVTDKRYMHVVSCQEILGVAREMLAGEVNYHHGEYTKAFEHLRKAVTLEDAMPYDEPWGWMMPTRHALGALLLEQGYLQEAAAAYEADLGFNDTVPRSNQHPDNVWALLGLYRCYSQLGRDKEARIIKPRLDFALSRADVEISASCFCSMSSDTPLSTVETAVYISPEPNGYGSE